MGYTEASEYTSEFSLDLIKNPVLAAKWNNYKKRSNPEDLIDIEEITKRGRNRVHKLLFKTPELERAAKLYFGEEDLDPVDSLVEGIYLA